MRDIFTILIVSLGLFLCAVVIVVYCLVMGMRLSAALREAAVAAAAAAAAAEAEGEEGGEKGLTAEELERLEEGTMAVGSGGECVVCWEEMGEAQALRALPGCRHAFHRSCIDAWLQRHPNCPL
uniref:RING-H2 finger protein ATL74-like n=1 Tax=Elaeis guineensis var. tenera TaxID=51953 RepID=A0A6I9QNC5_ELAGV